jgi:hypothetical protein
MIKKIFLLLFLALTSCGVTPNDGSNYVVRGILRDYDENALQNIEVLTRAYNDEEFITERHGFTDASGQFSVNVNCDSLGYRGEFDIFFIEDGIYLQIFERTQSIYAGCGSVDNLGIFHVIK